jgi:hypothetical protein
MSKDNNGTFKPLGDSDTKMHGDTAVLVAGHPPTDRERLQDLLVEIELSHLPLHFVPDSLGDLTLRELSGGRVDGHSDEPSMLPRAVVMSGLAERELHLLMKAYRESGLAQPSWAVVTPASETWTLRRLLEELGREREALKAAVRDQDASP